MKKILLVQIFLIIPLILFSQVDKNEDFYFSNIEEEIVSLNDKARNLSENKPAEKLLMAEEAYRLAVSEELFDNQVRALVTIGMAYFYLKEFDKSLEALTKSYNLSKRISYRDGYWDSCFFLGILYTYLEDQEKAISFFEEADDIVTEDNDKKHIQVYNELAKLYKSRNQYEKAIKLTTDALVMAKLLDNTQMILELTLLSGEIHFLAGDIRRANNLFRDIISETSSLGDFQDLRASAMSFMGKAYAILGDYYLALANGQDALLLSAKNDSTTGRIEAYDSLSFIYQNMGDFEKAYFHLQQYYIQKEIQDNEKRNSDLNKIKAYYESFEKEQEIDKQQTQIENQNRLILIGSLMIAIFIILVLTLYLLYRKNSRIALKLSRELKQEMVLSRTDSITGLPNKKNMEDSIQKAIVQWKKENVDFSLLFISFESYKKMDREWGEGSGSNFQKFISRTLKTELKGQDVIGVWKPFLFLILLPATDKDSLKSVMHKISLKLSKEKFILSDKDIPLDMKMGSYTYRGEGNRSDCIERCREELTKN